MAQRVLEAGVLKLETARLESRGLDLRARQQERVGHLALHVGRRREDVEERLLGRRGEPVLPDEVGERQGWGRRSAPPTRPYVNGVPAPRAGRARRRRTDGRRRRPAAGRTRTSSRSRRGSRPGAAGRAPRGCALGPGLKGSWGPSLVGAVLPLVWARALPGPSLVRPERASAGAALWVGSYVLVRESAL